MFARRASWLLTVTLVGVAVAAVAAQDQDRGHGDPSPPTRAQVLAALDRGLAWLVKQQSPSGRWVSSAYGAMRDDPALTPFVLKALTWLPNPSTAASAALASGREELLRLAQEPRHMSYPVYTTAAAVMVLSRSPAPGHRRALETWLARLETRQLVESLDWRPADIDYGGWGYAPRPPRRPDSPADLPARAHANLSATLFALGAMRLAGRPADHPAVVKARRFVERCQNADTDGGFFMSPLAAAENKAGSEGHRYRSYGSATADGLRALLACGYDRHHPRVTAALGWLRSNFSATSNPTTLDATEPSGEVRRAGLYHYWAWSVSHALARAGVSSLDQRAGSSWARDLAAELLRRQRADGSWANRFTEGREDEPIIATGWSVATLAICEQVMASGAGH